MQHCCKKNVILNNFNNPFIKNCPLSDKELSENDWKFDYEDEWPVARVKPLN